MIGVALKGLAGRKFRAMLTALAIVLGVAMVSGTYVLTDTIDRAFTQIFVESYAGTDAVVSGAEAGFTVDGTSGDAAPVPEELLERVRSVEGVEAATGGVSEETNAKLIGRDGKAIDTGGAPALGFGIDPEESRFNPLNLLDGRWPRSSGEIAIDAATADDEGYALGDEIGVAATGPVETFTIVGIARFGAVDSIGGATFAVFDIPTAQALFGKKGVLDAIQAAAEPGLEPERLVERLRAELPDDLVVRTGTESANEEVSEITSFTKFIRYFLLAFGGIALFVGAFVIFNTLSITVAQRTREFATLRTIGASRRQVLASVLLESLVIGVLASLVGLFLGLALAKGLNWVFVKFEIDLPQTALVFAPRTIVVSMLVGTLITLLAGLVPALRSTRVPPIAAVREGAALPKSRFSRYTPLAGVGIILLAAWRLAIAMFRDDVATTNRLLSIAAGVLALFVGVALLSSHVVPPLARALSPVARVLMYVLSIVFLPFAILFWGLRQLLRALRASTDRTDFPLPRLEGSTTGIAARNARRNPGRTAATAAALMIGLALVTFVAVLGEGLRTSNSSAIKEQVVSDYVVTSLNGFEPFVAAAGDALARSQAAQVSTSVRSDIAQIAGSGKYLTGVEPGSITQGYHFDWEEGSDATLAELGSDGAVVDTEFAETKQLEVGDRFEVVTPSRRKLDLVVKGLYKPPPFFPLLGAVSIAKSTFDTVYDRPRNQFTFVNVAGEPTSETTKALEQSLEGFPDTRVLTRADWIADQEEELQTFLGLLYILLALSVIVSLFGMVNTLVLSVYERTRELGMLRAVGMTRRQTRRMVRHESVITALIGAALGLPLGIFLAALVTQALSQFGLRFSVPPATLVIFAVVAVFAGILAAVLPARRAARLNVLNALQYE